MSWRLVQEMDEAEEGYAYRSTYFMGGRAPSETVKYAIGQSIRKAGALSGKMDVQEVFIHDRDVVRRFFPLAPLDTWAIVTQWKKKGTGTPLLFFMGPAGILTLAIIAVVVLVTGIVIVARQVERTTERVGSQLPDFREALPGAILGAVLLGSLYFLRGKS